MKFSDFDFSSESYGRICILAHGRKVHFPVGTETKMKEIYKDLSVEKTEKSEDGEWLYIYLTQPKQARNDKPADSKFPCLRAHLSLRSAHLSAARCSQIHRKFSRRRVQGSLYRANIQERRRKNLKQYADIARIFSKVYTNICRYKPYRFDPTQAIALSHKVPCVFVERKNIADIAHSSISYLKSHNLPHLQKNTAVKAVFFYLLSSAFSHF